jgi:hypothetical protein
VSENKTPRPKPDVNDGGNWPMVAVIGILWSGLVAIVYLITDTVANKC